MNFPSPTQALQARAQPGGITPELIRLLAQMKVKQETDAAARDMAMKSGMQPPTVADSVNAELEGNARQKIEQKLGGLQALSQQQAPQGAPTMPAPPAQPTQHMAAGGLARMKSNLPTRYAGGGIVAFDDGGGVDEDTTSFAAKLKVLKALGLDVANLFTGQEGKFAKPLGAHTREAMGVAPDTSDPNAGADAKGLPAVAIPADHIPTYAAPKVAPAVAASRVTVPASGQKAGVAAIPQTVVPTPTPLAPVEKTMNDALGRNGTAEAAAERTAAQARLEAALGGDQAALRAAKQQDYKQAEAAQTARDAKGELSIWDRLSTLGPNAALGNSGRAAILQRNMELAQEERKAEGAKGLLALKQASDAALLNDKIKAFDFAEGKGGEALKAAAEAQKNAMGDASRLLGTQGTNATTLAATKMQGENHLAVQKLANQGHMALAEAKNTSDLKERALQLKSAATMLKGAETAQLKLEADLMVPEAVKAEGRAKIAQLKQSIASIGVVPMVDTPAPGSKIDYSKFKPVK